MPCLMLSWGVVARPPLGTTYVVGWSGAFVRAETNVRAPVFCIDVVRPYQEGTSTTYLRTGRRADAQTCASRDSFEPKNSIHVSRNPRGTSHSLATRRCRRNALGARSRSECLTFCSGLGPRRPRLFTSYSPWHLRTPKPAPTPALMGANVPKFSALVRAYL